MKRRLQCWMHVVVASIAFHGIGGARTSQARDAADECSIYLAESSIKDAGWGVFAGKDFSFGEHLGKPGLGIQVIDPSKIYDANEAIAEFGWNSLVVGGNSEADHTFTNLPGIGMLANFHPVLSNVIPDGLTEESIHDRKRDPGAGSVTSYHNLTFIATRNISAGSELFASVGDAWFVHNIEADGKKPVPFASDYQYVDKIVEELVEFRRKYPKLTEAQLADIMYRIKKEMITADKKAQSLLPDSVDGLLDVAARGSARVALDERDTDWLEQHGKCLDNIRPGISTLPQAGRGAFAARFIPKGSIVSPAPLVQVIDATIFDTSYEDADNSTNQLLLNYCFGHAKSSLLLCPTTSVMLINHNKEKYNTKYRWGSTSKNRKDAHINYLVEPIDSIRPDPKNVSTFNSKLSFDFIATRDIQRGEEIFINYGEEWEHAWNRHIEEWNMPENSDTYVPARTKNKNKSEILLSTNPALVHHEYLCRLELFAREELVENLPEEDYRANPSIDPNYWTNDTRAMYGQNEHITWWPCDIVEGDSENKLFRAVVYSKSRTAENGEVPIIRKIKNLPASGIRFVDQSYHSDQHLSSAFRHYIPIPDSMFPLIWRNDYKCAESIQLGTRDVGLDISNDDDKSKVLKARDDILQRAKCGVYVAPSNIPNAGMGTYVAVTVPGKGFPLGSKVPVLPIADMQGDSWDAFNYVWNSHNFGAELEVGLGGSGSVLAINEGCMANFHPGLVNHENGPTQYDPVLDRRKDPGAGAFSDYVDYAFISQNRIDVGDEAFISYGEKWFSTRPQLGKVPMSANYVEANRIVASFSALTSSQDTSLSAEEISSLLNISKNSVVTDVRTASILEGLVTEGDVYTAIAKNGTAKTTIERRSLEWLSENGYCIDHIYSKDSTIPQAGKGAFARRLISKGGSIIFSPLILTWGREMFVINGTHLPDDIITTQLIYNYQYGHPDSSVLFFPTNTAITINHKSPRNSWGDLPNAELRWSTRDNKSSYFLQRPLEALKDEHYATMVLEFVAIRDINPDEEIFIDYGDEWDNAWNEHVKNYEPPCPFDIDDQPCFKSSKVVKEMNYDKSNKRFHTWSEDHFTVCHQEGRIMTEDALIMLTPDFFLIDGYDKEFISSFSGVSYDDEGFRYANDQNEGRIPCRILREDPQEGTFDVLYFTDEMSTDRNLNETRFLRRQKHLPSRLLDFVNKPYKSDMFWKGAFRHEIKIPDSIFPKLWKDLMPRK